MAEATPAGMLEPLGSELVARILQHLLPPDLRGGRPSAFAARSSPWGECAPAQAALHAARQTCRLLDEAARTHLLHTVTLTPEAAIGAAAGAGSGGGCGPDWARLLGIRMLRLANWQLTAAGEPHASPEEREAAQAQAAALRACLALGPGAAPLSAAALGCLAAVTALDLWSSELDARSLGALAARLPGLKALFVEGNANGRHVVDAAAGAPSLDSLYACGLTLDAAGAAALARLPALRALAVKEVESAEAWALLPCSRLMRLGCRGFGACGEDGAPLLLSRLEPPRFPQLQELRGVSLNPSLTSGLAHAAPRLWMLGCCPEPGAWQSGARHESLPNVTHALFAKCDNSFLCAVDMCRLLPGVQDLFFQDHSGKATTCPTLGGLTGLRALTFITHTWDIANVADLGAVARLSGLTRLACAVDPCDPAWPAHLARLTGLQELVLDVHPPPDVSDGAPVPALALPMRALFETVARMPRLHTLITTSPCEDLKVEWSFGALAHFVRDTPALRRLELRECLRPPLATLAALAMHPRLRRLVVSCLPDEFEDATALAGDVYAAGLECAVCVTDAQLETDGLCIWYWQ